MVGLGSENVLADLGLPDPDERHLRVQLALHLNDLLQAEGLTQAAAAKLLCIAQPHVLELTNYKLSRFSSERLLHYITLPNRDVEIFVRPRANSTGNRSGTGAVMVSVPVRRAKLAFWPDGQPLQELSR